MCGIGGVYIKNHKRNRLNALLYAHRIGVAQQNRGDFYSGMSWYKRAPRKDRDPFNVLVNEGSFLTAFGTPESYEFKNLIRTNNAKVATSHNRYKTEGKKKEGHPVVTRHDRAFKQFSLVHNGTMYKDHMKNQLRGDKANYIKRSDMDTEYARIMLARALKDFDNIPSIDDYVNIFSELSKKEFTPSYSFGFLDTNAQLIAVRDPQGIRPLCYFEDDEVFAFASQTDALLKTFSGRVGDSDIKMLEPGHMLVARKNKVTKHKFAESKKKSCCIFEAIYFMNTGGRFEDIMIQTSRNSLGEKLGSNPEVYQEMQKDIANGLEPVIAPVPGTGIPIANSVQEALYNTYNQFVPMSDVLIKVGAFRSFIAEGDKLEKVKFKFDVSHRLFKGKSVYLVDDSIVRGTTSKEITQYVKEVGGASKVNWLVAASPNRFPCFYGINMPTLDELIASNKTISQVREAIAADFLHYNSNEDMRDAVESCSELLGRKDFCDSCFTGDYPTREGQTMYWRAYRKAEKNGWKPNGFKN